MFVPFSEAVSEKVEKLHFIDFDLDFLPNKKAPKIVLVFVIDAFRCLITCPAISAMAIWDRYMQLARGSSAKIPISDIYRKFPELLGTCEITVKFTTAGSQKLRKVQNVSPRF